MRRIILGILTFVVCLLWAEVKVEKILETTAISEYNKWAHKTNLEYPGLIPVFIQSSYLDKGFLNQYIVKYYDQTGKMLKEKVLEDSLLSIYVPFTNDRLILRKKLQGDTNEVTVKNAKGQILFKRGDIRTHLAYTGIGVYVEGLSAECPADENTVLRIFNENGHVIGTLRGFGFINLVNICAPNDRRYCVFQGGNPYHSIPVIMLNREGKELWRYEIDRGVISLFISKSGSHIGILHSNKGKILVFDENGNLVQEYTPFGENFYWILSAFSDDGKWLVTGFRNGVKFYNNKTGTLVWENTETLKEKADTVKYVHVMKNANLIIVLCNSHNMYVFDTTGKLLIVHNLRLGKHLVPRRIHGTVTESEVLTQNWYSDVIGEYLIINKFTNGIRPARTQGDMKIIYRIRKS